MICGMWFTKLVGGICNKLRTYSMMNTMARVIILLCVIHLECWGQALSRLRISSTMERSLFSLAGGSWGIIICLTWYMIFFYFKRCLISFYILVSFVVCRWQRSGKVIHRNRSDNVWVIWLLMIRISFCLPNISLLYKLCYPECEIIHTVISYTI